MGCFDRKQRNNVISRETLAHAFLALHEDMTLGEAYDIVTLSGTQSKLSPINYTQLTAAEKLFEIEEPKPKEEPKKEEEEKKESGDEEKKEEEKTKEEKKEEDKKEDEGKEEK